MTVVELKAEYRCFDDCQADGCPQHEATLTFDTATNYYNFDDGKGVEHNFEQGALQTMVDLLGKLNERRSDSVRIYDKR